LLLLNPILRKQHNITLRKLHTSLSLLLFTLVFVTAKSMKSLSTEGCMDIDCLCTTRLAFYNHRAIHYCHRDFTKHKTHYICIYMCLNFLKTIVTIIKEMKTNVSIVLVSRGSFDRRLKQGFLATHCQVQLCELLYLEPFMCFKQMDHGHTVLMN